MCLIYYCCNLTLKLYTNVMRADLDRKISGILSIIVQDEGDSFAKRAEMYYQKRPELIQMVEDLHKSYRSLAEKYDQLRSDNVEGKELMNGKSDNSHSKSTCAEEDSSNKSCDEINYNNHIEKKNGIEQRDKSDDDEDSHEAAMLENEKLCKELWLEVSELTRRNDEKRETIRDLTSKANMLHEEHEFTNGKHSPLLTHHHNSNQVDKKNLSKLSRLKRLLLGNKTN
ncbi:KIP1-like protein [Corchorus capsularis]|uniref:KIP1-like protein n=1 Tax=Corchorus capsularis TaxID=210143 RepID=A0A1R3JQY4_COCAP|nr:KIP1-like protein [Corchorus capsularis]